jgi:iron complex outermembrane receptor protein
MRGYDGSFDYRAFDLTLFVPYRDTSNKYGVQVFGSVKDPESGSELRGWLYHDQQDLPTLLDQRIDTADVEYNRSLELSERTTLLVGAGYRVIRSTLVGEDPTYLSFDPESFTQNIFRAFAIGTTNLTDEVQLTAGMTLEHNDFTQFEFQPTARATWTPCADWMTWASISRAVRTPSLEEQTLSDISLYAGNESFLAEVLWAYEIGTRKMFGERVSTDLALFYNDYDNLHYAEFNGAGYDLTNKAQGSAWGSELALDVQPADWWRLRSAFSILHSKRDVDGVALMTDDYHPERLFNVRSYVDLGDDWELDSALYAVGRMGPGYEIAEYTRVDVRLGWTPTDSLELYAGVQDVGHATRSEYDEFDNPRRSVYFGLSWQPE